MERNNLDAIADRYDLTGREREDFKDIMFARFTGHKDPAYAAQWARRFRDGEEWTFADGKTRSYLMVINPYKYPENICGRCGNRLKPGVDKASCAICRMTDRNK